MSDMSVSCGTASMVLTKPPSEFDELFDMDDSQDLKVEIDNPYGAPIQHKKLLTCHGCKIEDRYFELKRNITVIECSRYGYSSTNPRIYRGNVVDSRMLLKKMKDAVTFENAIDIVRSSIVPEDESSVPRGATFELTKGTRAVARTQKFEGQPILMQEAKLFLRGCLNSYEGIYQLDSRGEMVDITTSVYGLTVREDRDRHPVQDFKLCSSSQEMTEAELKEKKDFYDKNYDDLIQKYNIERGNIIAHIQKLQRFQSICLEHEQRLHEPHDKKDEVNRKIVEYTEKLEALNSKIESIQQMKQYLVVDSKYYIPGRRFVYLSDILNHPATEDGTLFIIKVCKTICGKSSKIHGESRRSRRRKYDASPSIQRARSHDEYLLARSTGNVVKWNIQSRHDNSTSSSSGRERSRSREGSGVKANKNKRTKKYIYKRLQKKRNKKQKLTKKSSRKYSKK